MGIDAEMFVRTYEDVSPDELRKRAVHLYSLFGIDSLWMPDPHDSPRHCIEAVEEFEQDGPTITPENGERFYRVHLMHRFYGIGYERGPIITITAIASVLDLLFPGGRVFYGGDSSGVLAEEFGPEQRRVLLDHFVKKGHNPYRAGFQSFLGTPPPECPRCCIPMYNTGGGGNRDFWCCHGCHNKLITVDGKPSKWLGRHDSFHGQI